MLLLQTLKSKRYKQADLLRACQLTGGDLWPSQLSAILAGRRMAGRLRPKIMAALATMDFTAKELKAIDASLQAPLATGAADGASQR